MKAYDFINANIGKDVYLTPDGDLVFNGQPFKQFIRDRTPLKLIKLTKGGRAYLQDAWGDYYSVPPRNVRLHSELKEFIPCDDYEGLTEQTAKLMQQLSNEGMPVVTGFEKLDELMSGGYPAGEITLVKGMTYPCNKKSWWLNINGDMMFEL